MSGERYKMPISVQLMLFNKNNEVLLLKRKDTGFSDGKYGFIGGHVEKNENVKKAIIREAKEEVNIEIELKNLKFRSVLNRKVNENTEYIDFIFMAKQWNGNIINMEPEKCSELLWCKLNKLPQNMIDFEKFIIESKDPFLIFGWQQK